MNTHDLNMLHGVSIDLIDAVLDGADMHGFMALKIRCRHRGQAQDLTPVVLDVPQARQLAQMLLTACTRLAGAPPDRPIQ